MRKPLLVSIGATATSSILFFFGTGLHPRWWVTWLAPLPALLISPCLSPGRAFSVAAIGWFLGSMNMWSYLLSAIEIPIPVVLLLSAVPGCLFGLATLLFRGFLVRAKPWKASLSFPASWVTIEYLNSVASPHGTFSSLGYTQMDFLPVLQVTSLAGISGITFCLLLLPATLAAVANPPGTLQDKRRLAASVFCFLAIVIGWGSWRVASTPAAARSVTVGLMATGAGTPFPRDDAGAFTLLRDYLGSVERLAARGAQVVILPEKIALVSDLGIEQMDALLGGASTRSGSSIVVGLDWAT